MYRFVSKLYFGPHCNQAGEGICLLFFFVSLAMCPASEQSGSVVDTDVRVSHSRFYWACVLYRELRHMLLLQQVSSTALLRYRPRNLSPSQVIEGPANQNQDKMFNWHALSKNFKNRHRYI